MVLRRARWLILLLALGAAMAAAQAQATPQELLAAGRVDEAMGVLKARIHGSPRDAQAYHLLSRAYYAEQRWNESISAAQRAVALDPDNSSYHMWLGRAYGNKAERSSWFTALMLARKVRSEFERAVQLDGSSLDARTDLAEFYLEAPSFLGGGKDKAHAQAERIAAMDPATAHWVNGRIAEKERNLELAEREYGAAIQASDNRADYWLSLASLYRRNGRLKDMERAISQASSAQIKKADVLVDAAEMLFRAGRDFPTAVQFLQRYISSNATVEDAPVFRAHYLLGAILEKQGDKQAAASEYRAALALASEFGSAQEALARISR